MHTALSLKSLMFGIEVEGQPANREMLLDWRLQDRLGVVVTTPLGGLGASLLMQLATTAYYDARPSRRDAPHYAEIYVFHVGGLYGDFTSFDIAPPRREVFLEADPAALIEAINDRAITHLAIPDSVQSALNFPWSEAEAALDRIRHCYVYSARGRTDCADIAIFSQDASTAEDVNLMLEPQRLLDDLSGYIEQSTGTLRTYSEGLAARLRKRLSEVSEADREQARKCRDAISTSGLPRETYRRISVDDALRMMQALKYV